MYNILICERHSLLSVRQSPLIFKLYFLFLDFQIELRVHTRIQDVWGNEGWLDRPGNKKKQIQLKP